MTSACSEAASPAFYEWHYVCSWIILCLGSCAGHCGMFGPNPWSLSLGARSTLHIVTISVSRHHGGPTQTPWRATAALTPGHKNLSSTAAAGGRAFSHKPMRSPLQEWPVISHGCGALKEQHSLSQRTLLLLWEENIPSLLGSKHNTSSPSPIIVGQEDHNMVGFS